MNPRIKPLVALIASTLPFASGAAEIPTLEEIVVTAPRMSRPLVVATDPKVPQQPVPANDGASYLKNIPGFSLIRKGGTDGDPVLRGLAGSRLSILLDGMDFHGGCGMRMDPPTAYVFPELFDKVTVIKGPQTVAYGNGNSAGVVLFEHDRSQAAPENSADASLMLGAWDRIDALVTGKLVTEQAHLEASLTHAESGDYKDGDGATTHSAYQRQSATLLAGYRPDRDTRVDFDYVASRAEAAYADRTMDGVKFDRDSYGLSFEKANPSPMVEKLTARLYHTYIDHVMDNYSLRQKAAWNGMACTVMNTTCFNVSNPDRETDGARLGADLKLGEQYRLKLGVDWRDDEHSLRSASASTQAVADAYSALARTRDYESTMTGLYGELTHFLANDRRLIAGLRHDNWEATRYAAGAFLAAADRDLASGFLRYEQELSGGRATAFFGLGHNERPMDYWEAVNKVGLSTTSNLAPEKTTQLDTGLLWKSGNAKGSVSAFFAKADDFILTRTLGTAGCANANGCAENVDATRFGAEADLAWKLDTSLTFRGSLAFVHGRNDTMNTPLAQTPPLEGKLGLDYKRGSWTFGGVLRLVAEQDRVHVGYGNIVGQDYGRTPGFATVALNASYRMGGNTLISVGVDNVFDRAYSEHLARDNTFMAGANTRVNEPGRFIWAKISSHFN